MLEAVFWLSAILVLWTYLGYPMAMGARAFIRPVPIRFRPSPSSPSVSVVLAVRDEAARLEARVENLLAQTGLASQPQIVIAYNGCTDNTPLIARSLAQKYPEVEALGSPGEEGKAGALNRGVEAATGEIIIFADGRQMFAADAIQRLLEPYTDPEVGAVSGRLIIMETDVPAVGGVGDVLEAGKLASGLREPVRVGRGVDGRRALGSEEPLSGAPPEPHPRRRHDSNERGHERIPGGSGEAGGGLRRSRSVFGDGVP